LAILPPFRGETGSAVMPALGAPTSGNPARSSGSRLGHRRYRRRLHSPGRRQKAPGTLDVCGLRAFIHVTDRKSRRCHANLRRSDRAGVPQGLARVGPTAAAVVFLHGFGEHSSPVPLARERTERRRHRLWARQDRLRAHQGRPPASAEHRSSSPTPPGSTPPSATSRPPNTKPPLHSNPAATGGWSQHLKPPSDPGRFRAARRHTLRGRPRLWRVAHCRRPELIVSCPWTASAAHDNGREKTWPHTGIFWLQDRRDI
jgi:hypothetical protein